MMFLYLKHLRVSLKDSNTSAQTKVFLPLQTAQKISRVFPLVAFPPPSPELWVARCTWVQQLRLKEREGKYLWSAGERIQTHSIKNFLFERCQEG